MEEELKKKQQAEEEAAVAERERKRKLKMGAGTKKLSFAMDVRSLSMANHQSLHGFIFSQCLPQSCLQSRVVHAS